MDPIHTIADLVQHLENSPSNPNALNAWENGKWKSTSTESFLFDLKRLTYGLISLGLRKGDKVGILAQPSPEWNLADFATIMAGGISVPLFVKIAHESFIYEVAQANVRFLFVSGEEQWTMYEVHRNLFEHVIALDDLGHSKGALSFYEVLKQGEVLWEKEPELWEALKHRQNGDDIATIIYTAGSTGMPKGVLLTHQNLCHLISFKIFVWGQHGDLYLSILPLAHVFARQINLILMGWGVPIYYLNDLSRLPETCRELKPSLMIVVPRILEKIYGAMLAKAKGIPKPLLRYFVLWAFKLAQDPSESFVKKYILRPIADVLVYSKLRASLGGHWRVILSGGAALGHDLCRFFIRIGIPVYEGWGLTETTTTVVNIPGKVKVGSVGLPLPGVQIKLGQNDEVLVSGPTVMKGYYRNPLATEAVIDKEGWLHTGDKGNIDQEGYLRIVGRIKEQFKLSSGEYLAPSRIEHMLCQYPLIDMAIVVGERRKYAACLLFPDFSTLKRMKSDSGQSHLSDEEFLKSEVVRKEIQALLDSVNKRINVWEKLVRWRFILYTPTIEAGELTPTLKLKRDVILEKFNDVIEEMYEEGESSDS